jgi:hypothetical protein
MVSAPMGNQDLVLVIALVLSFQLHFRLDHYKKVGYFSSGIFLSINHWEVKKRVGDLSTKHFGQMTEAWHSSIPQDWQVAIGKETSKLYFKTMIQASISFFFLSKGH